MSVADPGDVLACRAEFHGHHAFGDELRNHWPDGVQAEDAIGLRVGDELHETARIPQRPGPAVGHEGKRAGAISDASSFELLLGLADPGDLWRRVDHPWHGVEIHMSMLAGDALGHGSALVLGLVREHRTAHDVADRPDPLEIRPAVGVDGDEPAFVELETDRLGVESGGVWDASDRDDQLVEALALLLALGVDIVD